MEEGETVLRLVTRRLWFRRRGVRVRGGRHRIGHRLSSGRWRVELPDDTTIPPGLPMNCFDKAMQLFDKFFIISFVENNIFY